MKGYTIDCDYVKHVKDYMGDCFQCPYHRLREEDGTPLPLISIEVEH